MKTNFLALCVTVLGLVALGTVPAQAQEMDTTATHANHTMHADTSGTVIGVARAEGSFQTLLAAIETAGLTEELMGEGPFTVFAPTDAAFDALDEGALEELMAPGSRENLKTLLRFHVVPGMRLTARDLQSRASNLSFELNTMGGGLAISSAEQGVLIGGATVASPDVEASNGIIHVMDAVIIPPALNDILKNN